MLEGFDILCLASANWDGMWVNAQQLMYRLAAKNRILYIESLGLRPPAAASTTDRGKVSRRLQAASAGQRKPYADRDLWLASPVLLPWHHVPLVRDLNDAWLAWWLQRQLAARGMEHPLVWSFLPTAAGLARRLQERGLVYFCVDDYKHNPGVHAPTIDALERRLISAADVVFTTSPALYEDRRALNENTFYTPNSADTAAYSFPGGAPPEPADLTSIPRPRFGYTGNISAYKIDLPLLEAVARAKPDWQLVFIGPVGEGDPSTDTSALQALPNTHFLGRKSKEELPAYVTHLDVGLIPNALNDSTRSSFPMKVYEYMAAGLPIAATPLPSLAAYRDKPAFCAFGAGPAGFLAAMQTALDAAGEPHRAARRAEAAKHDWTPRLEFISDAVLKRLPC